MNDHELSRDGAYFHSAAHEEADVVTHGVCQGCGLCAMVCPTHAMTIGGLHPMVHFFQKGPTLQLSLCVHCGRCASVCPSGTLHQNRLRKILRTARDTTPHTVALLCRNLFLLAPTPLDAENPPPDAPLAEACMSPRLDAITPPPGVLFATLRCTGRLGARFLDRLVLAAGVRNILVFACPPRQCAYSNGKCLISAQALGLADVYAAYGIPVRIKVEQKVLASAAEIDARLRVFTDGRSRS